MAQPQYEVITFQDDEGKRFQGLTRDHGRTIEQMIPVPLDVDDPVTDRLLDRGFADEQWITVSVRIQHGVGLVNTVFWSVLFFSSPLLLPQLTPQQTKRSLATFVCILFSLASAAPPSPNAPTGIITIVILCVAGGAIPGLYAALLIVDRLPRRTVDWMRLGIFMTFFGALVFFLAAASVTMAAICALQITTSMTTSSIAVALLHLRQPKSVESLQVGLALAIPSIVTWASGLLHGNFAVQWPLFLASFLFLTVAGVHRYIWATQYCGMGYRPNETDVALVDSYTAVLSHQITRFCSCCPVSNRPPVTNDGRTIRE